MLAETGRDRAEHLPGETKLEWQQELLQNFQQGSAGGWGGHCYHLTLLSLILPATKEIYLTSINKY